MKVKIYEFNIWDTHICNMEIPYRFTVVPKTDNIAMIFADVPNDTTEVNFKVNGSDELALIYNPLTHFTLPKSDKGYPIIKSDDHYDLDKPVLFTDNNLVNWSAVEQFDLIRLKGEIVEVLEVKRLQKELKEFSNWESIPHCNAIITVTKERQRE